MTANMRQFTEDIEKRLEKAYAGGASKKFGFEGVSGSAAIEKAGKTESEIKIARMENKAKNYLEQGKK